ncbi:MAG: MFS transporter, partial [Planctomyces sp.]
MTQTAATPFTPTPNPAMQPSAVRFAIAAFLSLTACLLYLDRYAVGIAAELMRVDLKMTQSQMSWFLSAFFWSYALCQVPAGWLSDRYGPRAILTFYILAWSLVTALLGVTRSIAMVLLLRFLCGAAQAGAYPVCTGMIRSWFPLKGRGLANSIVVMGGRFGAVLAPILTAFLMADIKLDWRMVLIVYGLLGIVMAAAFAGVCRDKPHNHPLCNDAERRLIASDTPELSGAVNTTEEPKESGRLPLRSMVLSLSLWGNSLTQFFTNIGWLFVVTWLPRYLGDVHQVPLKEQAAMTAMPTIAGIAGMFFGGWWTDVLARQFGLKWGRRLPIALTRVTAAAGYAACLALGLLYTPDPSTRWLPWAIIGSLGFAIFSCDLGVPAIWAYAQDVGGRSTASIMGWATMFGNSGAAFAPLFYDGILGEPPSPTEWTVLFACCAGVMLLSGATSLLLAAT